MDSQEVLFLGMVITAFLVFAVVVAIQSGRRDHRHD